MAKKKIRYSRLLLTLTGIALAVFVLIRLTGQRDKQEPEEAPANQAIAYYIGSASCAGCHKTIFDDHMLTPHYNTTSLASLNTIKGDFERNNSYRFSPRTVVNCERVGDKLYQAAYTDGVEQIRQPFDLVFGYGKVAQSFASWSGNKLVQLPLSYFTEAKQWINSPGYPDKAVFNRVITSRCMECHASAAPVISQTGPLEDFDRSKVIVGIDCEKCHGPASEHVKLVAENPDQREGTYITSLSKLSRQQSLDMCAVCHSGNIEPIKPSFSFRPGDNLKDFFSKNSSQADAGTLDVHGNQYGLLTMSKCFTQTELTCGTCHDPHKNEINQLEVFSQRCGTCHKPTDNTFCKVTGLPQSTIVQNCIDCHMPQKESGTIVFSNHADGTRKAARMRTHFIKIYPEEAKAIKAYLKNSN